MADEVALIVGAGPGFSGSVAKKLAQQGMKVALASRRADEGLAQQVGGVAFKATAGEPDDTRRLFDEVEERLGTPSFVMYNPSARVRGPFVEIDPADVERAIRVTAYGAFLVAQEAAKRMLAGGDEPAGPRGRILLTGATASVKGVPQSAAFAMGKFALRGLAQSMARELQPRGIHVLHVVIDGAIGEPRDGVFDPKTERLDPDAIAETALSLLSQPQSAWTWEVEVRPSLERF